MSDNEIYRFGGFRLEAGQRRLWHGQEPVDLPPKVFDTLLLLLRRAGLLITRDEFFACLWPNTVVTEASLGRHIWQVRKALERDAGVDYVQTVPKQGYRFVGEVEREAATAAPALALAPAAFPPPAAVPVPEPEEPAIAAEPAPPASPVPVPSPAPTPASPHPRRLWPTLAAGLLLAAAGTGGYLWLRPAAPAAAVAPVIPLAEAAVSRIAVFDFLPAPGAAAGDAWLSSALPELLAQELALNDGLQVINGQRLAELLPLPPGRAPDSAALLRMSRQLGLRLAMVGRYRAAPGKARTV
jgi:DNA-binding winged helix-turn-helix (wHTH) protein